MNIQSSCQKHRQHLSITFTRCPLLRGSTLWRLEMMTTAATGLSITNSPPMMHKPSSSSSMLTRESCLPRKSLWMMVSARLTKNCTGPPASAFTRLLAPLTRSLARSLRSLSRSWESESFYLFYLCFFHFRP